MLNSSSFLFLCLGLLAGTALGVGFYRFWLKRQADEKLRLPNKWPLTTRTLMTNEEFEVFRWLTSVFHDHMVMIKVSLLRFTLPVSKAENANSERWQGLLGQVYCTFTVCTPHGSVVGCVDVLGKSGLSKNNRQLKESLLSDCRIAYTSVNHTKLPEGNAMRAAFLGEMSIDDQTDMQDTRGGDSGFHADLDSFKEKRRIAKAAALEKLNTADSGKSAQVLQPPGFNPDGTGAFGSDKLGFFANQWEDSFSQDGDGRAKKSR